MLYNIVLVSAVQSSESSVHIYMSALFPFHLSHHRSLTCRELPVLYSRFSLVIYGMLLSHKEEHNSAIFREVFGPRDCHTPVK